VLPAFVQLGGLLPRMFPRALEVAEPSLSILMLQGSAASRTWPLTHIRLDWRACLGLVTGRYRVGTFFLVMRHVVLR